MKEESTSSRFVPTDREILEMINSKYERHDCLVVAVRFERLSETTRILRQVDLYVLGQPREHEIISHIVSDLDESGVHTNEALRTLGAIVAIKVKTVYRVRKEIMNVPWELSDLSFDMRLRENHSHDGLTKWIELAVVAQCASPHVHQTLSSVHKHSKFPNATILTHAIIGNIAELEGRVDRHLWDTHSFEVLIRPQLVLHRQAYWVVVDVMKTIPLPMWETQPDEVEENENEGAARAPPLGMPFGPNTSNNPMLIPVEYGLSNRRNAGKDLKTYHRYRNKDTDLRSNRCENAIELFTEIAQSEELMRMVTDTTGMAMDKKLFELANGLKVAQPHEKAMKKELKNVARYLEDVTGNVRLPQIFRDEGKKKLWAALLTMCDSLKQFRA